MEELQLLLDFIKVVGAPTATLFFAIWLLTRHVAVPLTQAAINMMNSLRQSQDITNETLRTLATSQDAMNGLQSQQVALMQQQAIQTGEIINAVKGLSCHGRAQ